MKRKQEHTVKIYGHKYCNMRQWYLRMNKSLLSVCDDLIRLRHINTEKKEQNGYTNIMKYMDVQTVVV